MLTIYGSMLCKDCVQCRKDLDQAGVAYDFLDITEDLQHLKGFLKLREGNSLFDQSREDGQIGIPCIVKADGSLTLDWEEFL